MKQACKLKKEKAGLTDSHDMKNEYIRDSMLQDENMLMSKNVKLKYI